MLSEPMIISKIRMTNEKTSWGENQENYIKLKGFIIMTMNYHKLKQLLSWSKPPMSFKC